MNGEMGVNSTVELTVVRVARDDRSADFTKLQEIIVSNGDRSNIVYVVYRTVRRSTSLDDEKEN